MREWTSVPYSLSFKSADILCIYNSPAANKGILLQDDLVPFHDIYAMWQLSSAACPAYKLSIEVVDVISLRLGFRHCNSVDTICQDECRHDQDIAHD